MESRCFCNYFLFFVFVAFTLTRPVFAGCGVNFDKMKKRRVEAIRGQILSKLGMDQLPDTSDLPPVPKAIEEMYNRTRDFVLETARQKRLDCEEREDDYYAQEIVTVNAKPLSTENDSDGSPTLRSYKAKRLKKEQSEFFSFDLVSQHIDPDAIMSASLRLFQVRSAEIPHGGRQKVELYQLSLPESEEVGSTPSRRFVTMKQIATFGEEGWVNFDVTSVVRQWVRVPGLNQGVEITVPCTGEADGRSSSGENNKLKIIFAGSAAYALHNLPRGDEEEVPSFGASLEHHPHLVVMIRSPSSQAKSHSRRKKRSLDAEYCFRRKPDEANCCLRELFIDFRQDLGWRWIHAPKGYNANFCAGACPYLWSMDTQHATILSLYKTMNPQASSSPCCSPKELEPLTIMYYDKGKYKLTQMSDMVLLSCNCS